MTDTADTTTKEDATLHHIGLRRPTNEAEARAVQRQAATQLDADIPMLSKGKGWFIANVAMEHDGIGVQFMNTRSALDALTNRMTGKPTISVAIWIPYGEPVYSIAIGTIEAPSMAKLVAPRERAQDAVTHALAVITGIHEAWQSGDKRDSQEIAVEVGAKLGLSLTVGSKGLAAMCACGECSEKELADYADTMADVIKGADPKPKAEAATKPTADVVPFPGSTVH